MPIFEQGDVLRVRFPYTDRNAEAVGNLGAAATKAVMTTVLRLMGAPES
jgi:hypothetical protein